MKIIINCNITKVVAAERIKEFLIEFRHLSCIQPNVKYIWNTESSISIDFVVKRRGRNHALISFDQDYIVKIEGGKENIIEFFSTELKRILK